MSDGVSSADLGTVAAVGVATGSTAAGLVRWMFSWSDRRAARRDAQLQAWEASLVQREKQYRETIEKQLTETRQQMASLRSDLDEQRVTTRRLIEIANDLSAELETHAPTSPALRRARKLLRSLPLPMPSTELEALAAELDGGNDG